MNVRNRICVLVIICCLVCYSNVAPNKSNLATGSDDKRTDAVHISSEMFVTSDKQLRKNFDEIIFLRGKVEYESTFKNPISYIVAPFGVAYQCMGIEAYAGQTVVIAAVPKEVTLPRRTGPPLGGDLRSPDGERKYIYLAHWRVLQVEEAPKSNKPRRP